jgi:8-oxo-dGTP diphosphatase
VGLSEAGFHRSPKKARQHTLRLLDSAQGGALCTHRPVLENVMQTLRERGTAEVAAAIPDTNPYLHPAEVLVAHVATSDGADRRIVAVERHGTR